jgi:hypothetical protein
VENQVYDEAANFTTADIVLQPGKSLLFVSFLDTDGGVKNVRLIRPGYPADSQQLFTDMLVESVRSFKVIRYMEWLDTNYSCRAYTAEDNALDWAERRLPDDATQLNDGKKAGVAWEYIIAFANQTGKDAWINLPADASDDYIRQLAQMLKAQLNPNIKIYLEHSNEMWNPLFSQYEYNRQAAVAEVEAGGSNLNNDGSTSTGAWTLRRHTRRTIEIGQIFAEVYGAEALNTRLFPVLSWRVGETEQYRSALAWVKATYGAPSQVLYGIAGAGYYNDYAAAPDASVNDILLAMSKDSQANIKIRKALIELANEYGLKGMLYEVGPDNGGNSTTNVANRIQSNRDPRIGGLILNDVYNNWIELGGDIYMHFNLHGYYSRHGCWGITEDLNNLHTPKFEAIYTLLGYPASGKLPPPATMSATVDSGTVNLTWSKVYSASGYTLKRFDPGAGKWQVIAENLAETTFTDTGLTDGETYQYAVAALNSFGEGVLSFPFKFKPRPLSEQPIFAANLVQNPEFDDQAQGWNTFFSAPAANGTVTVDTAQALSGANSLRYEIEKGGTLDWHVMLFQGFKIYEGNTYEISFQAATKSNNPVVMNLTFTHNADPWTVYWQQAVTLGEAPAVYGPYTFEAKATDEAVYLMFSMGSNDNSTIWFDAITIRQVGGDNSQGGASEEAPAAVAAKIAQAASAPVIDGQVDEIWNQAVAHNILNVNRGQVDSPQDLSGSFRLMWDEANLYLLAEVTDDALVNDSFFTHEDDAVELYLDGQHNIGTMYDDYDMQLKFGWDDVDNHLNDSRGNKEGIVFASVTTENGYIIEAVIPWASIVATPALDATIGLEVMLCDDDDSLEREAKMAWQAINNDEAWTNPSFFGVGVLTKPQE